VKPSVHRAGVIHARAVCEGGAAVRKLIESTLISLAGVIEAPNRWSIFDDESTAVAIEQLGQCDAFVMGRVTYQNLFARWAETAGGPLAGKRSAAAADPVRRVTRPRRTGSPNRCRAGVRR